MASGLKGHMYQRVLILGRNRDKHSLHRLKALGTPLLSSPLHKSPVRTVTSRTHRCYSSISTMTYTPKTSSPYAKTFVDPQGPGDARPTALDIVKDEGLEGKLTDKVMLITGCSSGLGIETAKAMAVTGAKLYLGVRNIEKGEKALKDVLKPGHIELLKMDLNSLKSVCSHSLLNPTDRERD